MEIGNKMSLEYMKTKHPSQVCRADRWLSHGKSTGGCCGHSRKAERTAYISISTRTLERFLPLLTGKESEKLPQSEVSAEGALEQINKMYNNKHCKKQMVLTQE